MTNMEVFKTILAEATGKPMAHVSSMVDLLIQAKPELAHNLNRPARPGILNELRLDKEAARRWLEEGCQRVAGGHGRFVKKAKAGDQELMYLDFNISVDNSLGVDDNYHHAHKDRPDDRPSASSVKRG